MKRLITLIFFAFFAISSYGQVVPNLPSGSVPFGTGLFRAPDGDIWGGSKFDGYTNLGNWERVADSLGMKINWSDTTLIVATKTWVAQQLNNLPPSGVLSVEGDGVDNTDPANPVLSYPTPGEIGALAPGGNVSDLTNDAGYLTTETDPVYSGDPAAGITSGDIGAWNAKQDAITGAASTIDTENLTLNRALISNGSGKVAVSPVSNTELAFLDGVTSAIQTQLNAKVPTSDVGASNGVAPLGADGKVPGSYLPSSGSYKGTWDASTNTPTLADGVGVNGDRYRVAVGGTVDLGSGNITFVAGDDVIYNGTIWQRSPSGVTVTSVAGKTGDVILVKGDVGLGNVDNTSDLDKPISTATQTALDGKENAFSKGSLVAGSNITLTGSLANRLVGSGNVTIDVDPGSIGLQTLSLGGTAGNIAISGGNDVSLASVDISSVADINSKIANRGLYPVLHSTGSTGFPATSGGGIQYLRSNGTTAGAFTIDRNLASDGKLRFNIGINGTDWEGFETFASEEWTNAQGFLKSADLNNYVTTNTTQTITGEKSFGSSTYFNSSAAAQLILQRNGNNRWLIGYSTSAETGGSTGSNFVIHKVNDDASVVNSIEINRATNILNFAETPTVDGNIVYHEGNLDPSTIAPETVITTSVNFTIDWQNDIAPNSGGKTYAEVHGNNFTYSAFYDDGTGALVNYSPAVKMTKSVGGTLQTVQFADVQNGEIVIK